MYVERTSPPTPLPEGEGSSKLFEIDK